MNKTHIGWTDYSSNPIRYRDGEGKVVWACVHASPGCIHCYSEALAHRYRKGGPFTAPVTAKVTPFLDEKEVGLLLRSPKIAGKRVFLCDMTDWAGEWIAAEMMASVLGIAGARPDAVFQLLTKRAKHLVDVFEDPMLSNWVRNIAAGYNRSVLLREWRWPLPNVWLGLSVEDQRRADERIPLLLQTPAAVRFVSAEPLLGPVDISIYMASGFTEPPYDDIVSWVIAGGESGPGARPMELHWLVDIVRDCQRAGVPLFVKQDSGPRSGMQGRIPDELWALKEFPVVNS